MVSIFFSSLFSFFFFLIYLVHFFGGSGLVGVCGMMEMEAD